MNLWTHMKTGNTYLVLGTVHNSTNDRDGDLMIRYRRCVAGPNGYAPIGDEFVREAGEFLVKFERLREVA
jgi:hypothetical protein